MAASRRRLGRWVLLAVATCGFAVAANAQPLRRAELRRPAASAPASTAPAPSAGETKLLQALAADPVTGPYAFATAIGRDGRVVLGGRVGTKQAHDQAVQIAIATGIPFTDALIIDTAETMRAAGAASGQGAGNAPAGAVGGSVGALPTYTPYGQYSRLGSVPYVYPQPLFGYYDEPFYGFDPPVISYPPEWRGISAMRYEELRRAAAELQATKANRPAGDPNAMRVTKIPAASGREEGRVEATIGNDRIAVLTGVVPTEADKADVERRFSEMPGVRGVRSEIVVRDPNTPPPLPTPADIPGRQPQGDDEAPAREVVPPPPAPGPDPRRAVPKGAIRVADPTDAKLAAAIARRPELASTNVRANLSNGVAIVVGDVPSAREAMLAYRAVEQVPGVREVDDRLSFPVPAVGAKNPLVDARPEDVEPYLLAQIRRQLGDGAHIDSVKLRADALVIRGTVDDASAKPRIEAVLRTMPLLRGFRPTVEMDVN